MTFKLDICAGKDRDELARLFRQRSRQLGEATRRATWLAIELQQRHFPEVENWEPEHDLTGLLLQIDNMTTALERSLKSSTGKTRV